MIFTLDKASAKEQERICLAKPFPVEVLVIIALLSQSAYSGVFTNKKIGTFRLEAGRAIQVEPKVECIITKTTCLDDHGVFAEGSFSNLPSRRTNLSRLLKQAEVSMAYSGQDEIVSSRKTLDSTLREYARNNSIPPDTGQPKRPDDRSHATRKNTKSSLNPYERAASSSSGAKRISIADRDMDYGEFVGKLGEKAVLNYAGDVIRARIVGSARKANARSAAKAAGTGLGTLLATSLSDGPEFGPVDAILALGLISDAADLASEVARSEHRIDHRRHNRIMKIRYPEMFENSPIDVCPRTGSTVVKDLAEYYSNFPEPYRTYMYNLMRKNPGQWGVSEGRLEWKFKGVAPANELDLIDSFRLSQKQKVEIRKAEGSSQGYQ